MNKFKCPKCESPLQIIYEPPTKIYDVSIKNEIIRTDNNGDAPSFRFICSNDSEHEVYFGNLYLEQHMDKIHERFMDESHYLDESPITVGKRIKINDSIEEKKAHTLQQLREALLQSIDWIVDEFDNFNSDLENVGMVYTTVSLMKIDEKGNHEQDEVVVMAIPINNGFQIDEAKFRNINDVHGDESTVFERDITRRNNYED